MKILVCGSRHYLIYPEFKKYLEEMDVTSMVSGGAQGADYLAQKYAEEKGIPIFIYPADWEKHGRAAGPIRNKQMLDEGKPDMVIAFWDRHSKGTKNMMDQAKKAGVPVKVVYIQ